MADENVDALRDKQEAVLNLDPRKLVNFLNAKGKNGADTKCLYCGVGDYAVSPGPTGQGSAVVSAPAPNVKGKGAWFYIAICTNCGNTQLFSCAHVAQDVGLI